MEKQNTEQDALWEALKIFDNYDAGTQSLPGEIETMEINRIRMALDFYDGNRSKAAKDLGIGRTNLIAKIKKYNL
jgi:transcriptional regulator with PAS, ATPase and Fis domain